MSEKVVDTDPILDLYGDIQAICKTATSRDLKLKASTNFSSHVHNKIKRLKESENGEILGGVLLERLWSYIPEDKQNESAAAMCDMVDNLLHVGTTNGGNLGHHSSLPPSSSKMMSPIRTFRRSSTKNFSINEPMLKLDDNEAQQKIDALKLKIDEITKAKKAVESDLSIANEYVKIADMKLQASAFERDQLKTDLANSENKIEALEAQLAESKKVRSPVAELQKRASDAESYAKYMAERLKEMSARLEEEERKTEEMAKSLQQATSRELILSQQLKDALAKNNASGSVTPEEARLASRLARKTSDDSSEKLKMATSVAETTKYFERMKNENPTRRRISDRDRGSIGGEYKEGTDDVLEFPTRRLSAAKTSVSSTETAVGDEKLENFVTAKDMWKRRDSASFKVPLPAAYIREKDPKKVHVGSGKSGNAVIEEGSSKSTVKDFWKQRESLGTGKAIFPVGFGTAQPRQNLLDEKPDISPPAKRMSVQGISIPVAEIKNENNSKDKFDIPEIEVNIPMVVTRRSSLSSFEGTPKRGDGTPKRGDGTPRELSPLRTPDNYSAATRSDILADPSKEPATATPFTGTTDLSTRAVFDSVEKPHDLRITTTAQPKATDVNEPESAMSPFMSPGFDSFDPDRVFDDEMPIVLVEVGESEARAGLWNVKKRCFELRYSCPAVVAVIIRGGGKPHDIVKGANIGSDPMYVAFRETGIFVGKDAWYCCFDHPDAGLRGVLELENLIGGGRIRNVNGFVMLIHQCMSRTLPLDAVWPDVQILFNYNVACDRRDLTLMTRRMFEYLECSKICFLDEAGLIARGTGLSSAVVVDIGNTTTKVQPVYENITMRTPSRVSKLGGEHCTNYLETLLHAQKNERFSSQLQRRRKQIARQLKNSYAFISDSFTQNTEDFGEFSFEAVNVMSAMGIGASKSKLLCNKSNRNTDMTSKIKVKEAITLSDGSVIVFTLDIERFYCVEVLFRPDLHEECKNQQSLHAVILQSVEAVDELVRKEVCECIILSGKSSLIPGLKDRLRTELKDGMSKLGVPEFQIIIAEDTGSPPAFPSASWKGADYSVKRATDPFVPYNIEPQHFVTISDYEEQGNSLEPNLF